MDDAPDDAAAPPGTFLPVLREAAWPDAATTPHRRLLGNVAEGPYVTFGWDTPSAIARMSAADLGDRPLADAERVAVSNLAARDWSPQRLDAGKVVLPGEHCSAAILLPAVMDRIAMMLASDLIAVAIPAESLLAAVDARDAERVRDLIAWCRTMFDETTGRRISPVPLLVQGGAIAGLVVPRPPSALRSALQPPPIEPDPPPAEPAPQPPIEHLLPVRGEEIDGLTVLAEYAGAMHNAIHAGRIGASSPVLVTSGPAQRRPLAQVRRDIAVLMPGMIAPAQVFDRLGPGGQLHLLVEERPPGAPLTTMAPMAPERARRLLIEIAAEVAAVHAAGATVLGVRPELVFAEARDGGPPRITGIAGHTMRFLLGMPPSRGGLCLPDVYLPREVWTGGAIGPAVDVFSLCALGYFLVTGRHPYPGGGGGNDALHAVMSGAPPSWDDVPLADLLAPGLTADPAQRPSLSQLRRALGDESPEPPRKKPWFKFW